MGKALLINPGSQFNKPKPNANIIFPFGLGYIASFAEKHGHKIDIWDIRGNLLSFDEVLEKMKQFDLQNYDYIGITGIVNQYLYIKRLTENLKNLTDIKVVVGGPLSTYSWKVVLENTQVDICVIGEGEQTFLDLLTGKELSSIKGIAFKSNNGIKRNLERDQIKNLDDIGMPAFHLFDMAFYITHSGLMDIVKPFYKNKRGMALITSRGCPYNCKFCSKSTRGIRMKSLDFLFNEIEFYKNELRVDSIHFVDELLLLNKKRFLEFCRRIKKYDIIWDCQARINLVDEQILLSMKSANAVCIGFGIESGSQKILDAMNKRIKVADIERYVSFCLKIQLPVKVQVIFGYPGESKQTLTDTINLFKKLKLPGRRFSVITPLPGAELYEEAKNNGFLGDKDDDQISEVKYLEFLSMHGGNVTRNFFYNKTEFSNEDFFMVLRKLENTIFNNFIKYILFHPSFLIKNRSIFKMYLRNWWDNRGNLILLNLLNMIKRFLSNPKEGIKLLKSFIRQI